VPFFIVPKAVHHSGPLAGHFRAQVLENRRFSLPILYASVLFAKRQFLRVTLPSNDVALSVSDFPAAVSLSRHPPVRFRA
jgi:hypothetical protein